MTGPASRRGFLRDLVGLPLIGGGLTLIGAPTAVAEPVTNSLLSTYDTWLFYERRFLRYELFGSGDRDLGYDRRFALMDTSTGRCCDWIDMVNAGGRYHGGAAGLDRPMPSNRAALVLSTVGCNWRA